jgi:hypothetical protein
VTPCPPSSADHVGSTCNPRPSWSPQRPDRPLRNNFAATGRGVPPTRLLKTASSGKITRRRLNPAGDRQANHALWRIVLSRMSSQPRTRAYVERRVLEGKTKMEIMRCLKRYVAREVYPLLAVAVAD